MKLIDKNHVPSSPKSWRTTINGNQYRVAWENTWHWEQFYSEIVKMSQTNNIPVPTEDQVQEFICKQIPKGWCTDSPNFHRPPHIPSARRSGGCSSCARRR